MNEFLENLKRQAVANPAEAMGIATVLIIAISRLSNANSEARNSRTWAREERRRERKDRMTK